MKNGEQFGESVLNFQICSTEGCFKKKRNKEESGRGNQMRLREIRDLEESMFYLSVLDCNYLFHSGKPMGDVNKKQMFSPRMKSMFVLLCVLLAISLSLRLLRGFFHSLQGEALHSQSPRIPFIHFSSKRHSIRLN